MQLARLVARGSSRNTPQGTYPADTRAAERDRLADRQVALNGQRCPVGDRRSLVSGAERGVVRDDQRSRIHRGCAGVGVGAGEQQRPRTLLGQRAGPADDVGNRDIIRAIEHQRATIGDRAGTECPGRSAIADLEDVVGRDSGSTIGIGPCQHQSSQSAHDGELPSRKLPGQGGGIILTEGIDPRSGAAAQNEVIGNGEPGIGHEQRSALGHGHCAGSQRVGIADVESADFKLNTSAEGVCTIKTQRPESPLDDAARAADETVDGHDARSVEDQSAVVDDVAPSQRADKPAIADLQRSFADRGHAGVGVVAGEHQRPRAGLGQRAGAVDGVGHGDIVRPAEHQRALVGHRPAAQSAGGAAVTDPERAAEDRGRARISVGAGQGQSPRTRLGERSGTRNRGADGSADTCGGLDPGRPREGKA